MSEKGIHKFDQNALMRVLEVAKRLGEPLDLPAMLERVIDAGREVFAADRGAIFLYDSASRELYSVVATGVQEIRFSVDVGIAGECAVQRKVVNVHDCQNDPRFNKEIDKATGYVTRNLIAVPLVGTDDELVGVLELLNTAEQFDEEDERLLTVLASQAAVAIQRTHLMEERLVRVKLEQELDIARDIQQRLLPTSLPDCPGYDLAVFNEPADQTGGDLYDVVALSEQFPDFKPIADQENTEDRNDSLLLVLGDATGHGIGPALTVTLFRALLRMGLRSASDLNGLVDQSNQQLHEDLAVNRFITAFMGILYPNRHEIIYQAPGQAPLLHYHYAEDRCEFHDASALPLGIIEEIPLEDEPLTIDMQPGDFFVLLTDGFYERQSPDGDEYGLERLGEQVSQGRDESASDLLQRLRHAVETFAHKAPPSDDLTAVILRRLPE